MSHGAMTFPAARIYIALTASALLHLALLAGRLPAAALPKPTRLEVQLLPVPDKRSEAIPATDPGLLEKNTLEPAETAAPAPPPKHEVSKTPARVPPEKKSPTPRKLSDYIVYPPEAKALGHEGTVHLLLKLDPSGLILQASVAAGSGYPELDDAALKAALHAGRFAAGGRSELILPITFRLP